MLRELRHSFRRRGWFSWIPLLVPVAMAADALSVIAGGASPEGLSHRLWQVYPIFAFFWPVDFLAEPLHPEGGDIFFVYRRGAHYWMGRTALLIFAYAALVSGMTALVSAGIDTLRIEGALRAFFLAGMYGWMGAAAMLWLRDAAWSLFFCLTLFLFWEYSRLDWLAAWFNPHRTGRGSGEIPILVWTAVSFLAAALRLRRYC